MKIKVGLKKYQDVNKLFKQELLKQVDILENQGKDVIEEMTYGMKDEFYEGGSFILRFGEI